MCQDIPDLLTHDAMFHLGVVPCGVECHVICGRNAEPFEVLGGGGTKLGVAPHELGLCFQLLIGHLAVVKRLSNPALVGIRFSTALALLVSHLVGVWKLSVTLTSLNVYPISLENFS